MIKPKKTAEKPKSPASTEESLITSRFIESACKRLREGNPLRRQLQPWGRVHIDRQLPFLVVYRRPADGDEDTDSLVVGEASYLRASGDSERHEDLSSLVEGIVTTLSESFGAFLIIELWAATDPELVGSGGAQIPRFRIRQSGKEDVASTVNTLDQALGEIQIKSRLAEVQIESGSRTSPDSLPPLLSSRRADELGCRILGVEIRPIYRDPGTGHSFPLVRRALHRGLSRALKRTVFEFTRSQTTQRPRHYQALGRRSMVKAVWEVDRRLAEVSSTFDFLLQVTPVNADGAWREFRRRQFEAGPKFVSRPLRLDPTLAKRELFQIPIERVEDPTLGWLFQEQQREMDRKLSMLSDRGTPRFLYGSLQVFGGVSESLLNLAYDILNRIPSRSRDESTRGAADAESFAELARGELQYYRDRYPEFSGTVQIRPDIVGLMVSRGNLLVGAETRIPQSRVAALLAHEVGTHMVTFFNGKAQPFRQLNVGLPGYEELQEGLAVLAEYLVGGLSRPRLRLLAARVVAVRRLIDGATFVELFRELDRAHDFAQRTAFNIAMRVYRGGGLTKDAVYLKGLVDLLAYLREGGKLEPLLVGKIALEHIHMIKELRWRQVLVPDPLRPRYLDDPKAIERLDGLRKPVSVLDLVKRREKR